MLASLLLALLTDTAYAQAMTFDPVFVSRFVPETDAEEKAGEHLRTLLEERLSREFLLIARAEVPAFEDYTSEVYLQSCPKDEFFGCAFVIGSRAQAEWVVAGQVSAGSSGSDVTVVFIDVTDSRMVFSFEATVSPANEKAFADGVASLMHKIVAGAGEERDIRGAIEDPAERAAREKLQREALAASLSDLEGDLGAMARTVVEGEIENPRLTKDDLARKYTGSDEAKPWDRVGMSEAEYVRFRNSGKDLSTWRLLKHGRFGRIVVSAQAGPSGGPFSQQFDGRWGLNETTLALQEVDEFQEVENGGAIGAGLELAVGVHPWIDVGFGFIWRTGEYTYLFNQEVEGQVPTEPDPTYVDDAITSTMSSFEYVGRVRFVPMSTYSYRPFAQVGLGTWKGTSLDRIVEPPRYIAALAAPAATFLELGAGGELDPSKVLTVFAALQLQVPLAGQFVQEYQDGPPTIVNRAEPDGPRGGGAELMFGVRARLGPLLKFDEGPKSYDEDEAEPGEAEPGEEEEP
jgi:hypothetical protein